MKISIDKIENEKDAVMISKVIGDYLTLIYLQKNILNIGFLPAVYNNIYYYKEVFKGEEGEIILNNKIYPGKLYSRLIKKWKF